MRRVLFWCSAGLLLAALAFLLLTAIVPSLPWSMSELEGAYHMREHFYLHGVEESGAINLVSAIYLGYRAFDTLGETIVLVLSVAGVVLITGAR